MSEEFQLQWFQCKTILKEKTSENKLFSGLTIPIPSIAWLIARSWGIWPKRQQILRNEAFYTLVILHDIFCVRPLFDFLVMVNNTFNLKINTNLRMIGFHYKSLSLTVVLKQPFCDFMLKLKINQKSVILCMKLWFDFTQETLWAMNDSVLVRNRLELLQIKACSTR